MTGAGGRGMRYPASEKLEIIRTVEGSHLPTKKTLDMLGILRTTSTDVFGRSVLIYGASSMSRKATDEIFTGLSDLLF